MLSVFLFNTSTAEITESFNIYFSWKLSIFPLIPPINSNSFYSSSFNIISFILNILTALFALEYLYLKNHSNVCSCIDINICLSSNSYLISKNFTLITFILYLFAANYTTNSIYNLQQIKNYSPKYFFLSKKVELE